LLVKFPKPVLPCGNQDRHAIKLRGGVVFWYLYLT